MNHPVAGAIAGLAGTVAMTAAMRAMFRALPEKDRYPLPPRLITDRVVGPTGLMDALDEPERRDLTLALHYGYGAAAGALYPAVAQRVGGPAAVTGIGYGLAVWGASYLGWIPAMRILTPATRHPRARNSLMLAAHVVWGGVTGVTAAYLMSGKARADLAQM
ncbi:hypothetical protein Sp245p_34350 (plasmid) [Azospirillum baldaniorum]|uniref:DUF1440 domain-containing protein n=1 Tax=Azospirillum baldaniorum TaxID=1064539 RepID=A0A9P1K0K0_9PROT|nr:conserved membrane protein of unknown function [Azospirillum baldaniorum]AWJ94888.1 hypothetical protein Sp245p_34350 [Azospirillum baldaniorum]TWA74974.1 hypothetical protein FBZ85_11328 [Azospirillum brasilense]CCD03323.1 conserved membrane protein of unknown function [Azospirillum baldaniorum]